MAMKRRSLDELLLWNGVIALLVLFVPTGTVLLHRAAHSAERSLAQHGAGLGRALSGQIVEPMLVNDRLGLHRALRRVVASEEDVRYLAIENARGDVVAHTFGKGVPAALVQLWSSNGQGPLRLRTADEGLMDIPVPVMGGRLGVLHVGMSRLKAQRATYELMWPMGLGLAAGIGVIFFGARIVAARVSKPLRDLEKQVSLLPHGTTDPKATQVSGTREVESLARSFAEMAGRMEALEAERESTRERIVHTERLAALGQLSAGLAHEIFNPLDGMLECLRYLEDDPDKGPRAAKYYPMLEDGLQRISHVMKGMLGFARSGMHASPEPASVARIMEALELLVDGQLRDRYVRLTWAREASCVCMCDKHSLSQVSLNLVLNAVDACESSSDPHVHVSPRCDAKRVYISVEDSGPGVPEENRERIFDPFFTTKPRGKGTGLGLSVSRDIVRAQGGDLVLSREASSLGGAHFIIELPKVPGAEVCNACQG